MTMDKAAEKAMELLQQLAEKMGKTVEQLFPYFVRQVLLEAWAWMIAWAILTGMLFGGGVLMYALSKPSAPDEIPSKGLAIALMALAMLALVFAVAYNAPFILNPDYAAIREIMRAESGK